WNYKYQHDAYWAEMEKSYNRWLESNNAGLNDANCLSADTSKDATESNTTPAEQSPENSDNAATDKTAARDLALE
ncbi:hypothetical protein LPJ73_001994, partial [Coemansia sp. RSA 2703]